MFILLYVRLRRGPLASFARRGKPDSSLHMHAVRGLLGGHLCSSLYGSLIRWPRRSRQLSSEQDLLWIQAFRASFFGPTLLHAEAQLR